MKQLHNQSETTDLIAIGRFGRPIGVRGQLKLFAYSREPANLADYQPWFMKDDNSNFHPVTVDSITERSKYLSVKLNHINDRDAAQAITNQEIWVEPSVLPALEQNQYYWRELIGLEVINHQDKRLGKITELFETGSNDVMVVDGKGKQHLIPFLLDAVITEVQIEKKLMRVDWDEDF